MKKTLLSFTVLMVLCEFVCSQVCTPPIGKGEIDINKVKAMFKTGGDMFGDDNKPKFEVPKGQKTNTMFTGSLWIGGYDEGGKLKTAAMTYRQHGVDFWAGPVDTINVTTDQPTAQLWDKIWKINKSTVDSFRLGLFATIPSSILDWPAHGDNTKNQAKYIAPFFDLNSNGFYEPGLGDYPCFPGDQALFFVFNDVCNIHSETGGDPLGIEVHALVYAYNRISSPALLNTIFINYKIINRTPFNLDSVYVGQWIDFDIGNFTDDYVGCYVGRNAFYGYNGDAMDGTGSIGEYGNKPPAQAVVFLKGPVADAWDGKDNNRDGVIDEFGETCGMSKFLYYDNMSGIYGNPQSPLHYYRYMAGRWGDGTPMTYGGHGQGGSISCDFMFPGNSDQEKYWGTKGIPMPPWDEGSAGNAPQDRRGLGTSGPFTMQPGEITSLDYAYVFGQSDIGDNLASVMEMKSNIDSIQKFYDANLKNWKCGGVVGINEKSNPKPNVSIYPNPVNNTLSIYYSGVRINSYYCILDVTGREILKGNLKMQGKTEADVSTLDKGVYILRINSDDIWIAEKFMKQ